MNKIFFFFFLTISKVFSCNFSFSTLPSVIFTYTGSDVSIQNSIVINRTETKNSCRRFFITLSKGFSSTYNRLLQSTSGTLPYNLYKESSHTNIIKEFPDISSTSEVIIGIFPKNSSLTTLTVSYYSLLPAVADDTAIPPGSYSDSITAKLYKGNGSNDNNLEESSSFNITTNIPKEIDLSLVNTGAPFDLNDTDESIDFGSLSPGQTNSFDIRVVTNAGYDISFSSANNGKLKHIDLTDTIDYIVNVNASPVDLSSSSSFPVTVGSGGGISPVGGNTLNVQVQIGSFSNKSAGNYQDHITIEAATID